MKSSIVPPGLFAGIPKSLIDELISALVRIEVNYREHRWEPSELNGGKLCEVAYSILKGYIDGAYPSSAGKPSNMVDACHELAKADQNHPRSVRIQIPRLVIALYEIRNNRGVGHVGGDVNPNAMDAICVLQMAKWIVGELIRVFHSTSTERASEIVQALSNREVAMIWEVDGVKRVLNTSMSFKNQTLLLLYGSVSGMTESELVAAIEPSQVSSFRRDVLRKAHSKRLIEYRSEDKLAKISPLGSKFVEEHLLLP